MVRSHICHHETTRSSLDSQRDEAALLGGIDPLVLLSVISDDSLKMNLSVAARQDERPRLVKHHPLCCSSSSVCCTCWAVIGLLRVRPRFSFTQQCINKGSEEDKRASTSGLKVQRRRLHRCFRCYVTSPNCSTDQLVVLICLLIGQFFTVFQSYNNFDFI